MNAAKQLEPVAPANVQDLSGGILSVIARAASDPNVDVDKLERLLAMQERVLEREAEQAYNAALRAAQEEIKPVLKNRKNTETKSTYADLEQISEDIDPVIHRHGFSLSFGTADCPIERHYRVTCRSSHSGGFSRDYQADVPVDMTGPKGSQNKTMTHGFGSALSYGRRYLKLLIFDVATTDDDGRAAGSGATVDDGQLVLLQGLAGAVRADLARFCRLFRVDSLKDIPAARYEEAVAKLRSKAPEDADLFMKEVR